MSIFGHVDKIPEDIPIAGTLLNITDGNGSLDNLIMPELPECDLEKELDNVSIKATFNVKVFLREIEFLQILLKLGIMFKIILSIYD